MKTGASCLILHSHCDLFPSTRKCEGQLSYFAPISTSFQRLHPLDGIFFNHCLAFISHHTYSQGFLYGYIKTQDVIVRRLRQS